MSHHDADAQSDLKDEMEAAIAYRVISLFLESRQRGDGKKKRPPTAEEVAAIINREFNVGMNRQGVYRQLALAMERGLIRAVPPLSKVLAEKVAELYDLKANSIHVVHARAGVGDHADRAWIGEQVARHGAERVLALVKQVWNSRPQSKSRVSIGVGPGRATLEWARHFSRQVRSASELPHIELIAITAGGDPEHSEFDPTSFFSLFDRDRVSCVGLYAQTLMEARERKLILERDSGIPGIMEAWGRRDDIDIVISSMGDPKDEHDLLTQNRTKAKVKVPPSAVGNVQFRYYDEHAPIHEKDHELRAFTLFELEDFQEIANTRTRHVVLMARSCGLCPRSRAQALRPLLVSPKLKLWTEIAMDVKTADELIANPPTK